MTSSQKRAAALGGGVLVLAAAAFFLLSNKSVGDIPIVNQLVDDPVCQLSGEDPAKALLVERPAVAIKIENNPSAYPLSGLDAAEVVYEEPVEGGLTRFMAIYHCTDAAKAGPVRSARVVDPAIMSPYTLILGAAGGNDIVRNVLDDASIVIIDENEADEAMFRVDRPGVSSEHTLYADSAALRRIGKKSFDEPPPDDLFSFGDLEGKSKRARTVTITFSGGTVVRFDWSGERWIRFDNETALVNEEGEQFAADNVIIEEHVINFAKGLGDVLGTPSPEIADVTGSGKAVLFRDGRAIVGRWIRDDLGDAVRFESKSGDEMILATGTTWIEIVPNDEGDVKGSFSFGR